MMFPRIDGVLSRSAALLALIAAGCLQPASALPSFARQTGMECGACHVGAYGPQLTATGIRFKLGGYTDGDGGHVPLSGMAVGSYTRTRQGQDPAPEHLKANDNLTLDEVSAFLGGRVTEHTGAFVQVTYDGVGRSTALDQMDLRYARTVKVGTHQAVLGVSVNNNPGVQDPFNTLPAWSFPFVSSPAGVGTGEAASLLNGGLEGRVLGASAYTFIDDHVYAEVGAYRSMSPALQKDIGLDADPQRISGNTYWRLGWMTDRKRDSFHVGTFGWSASVAPDRAMPDERDRHQDIGVDAGYQFLGDRHQVFSLDGSYTRERLREAASGETSTLHETRFDASWYLDQTWGMSAGLFSTSGSDPALTTRGTVLQVDWTPWGKEGSALAQPAPWANLRVGAQYWIYNRFEGAAAGAKDADTAFLFAWVSF